MNTKIFGLACAVFVSGVMGCTASGEEDATLEVGVASESSALQAEPATPDPATAAAPSAHPSAHVRIKVKEIRVHIAGSGGGGHGQGAGKPAAADDDSDGDGKSGGNGWTTVFSGDRTIELDRTVSIDSLLGSAHAKAGKVTQIRLILDGQATLVDGGKETPLACGSCDTSGLKIIPKGDVRLESGRHHHFVLAFDLEKSLVDEGGQLRLKPVLRLAQGK